MSRNILIAGCGDLGAALASRLNMAGDTVFGLRRDPAALPPGIHPIASDLRAPDLTSLLPADLDAVVFSAAPGARDPQAYRAVYDQGLENLLEAISRRQPSPRLVLVSSTGVYGHANGEWVDEDTPPEPRSQTAPILLAAEARVRAFGEGDRGVSVLRLGGIYGPGRTRGLRAILADPAAYMSPAVFSNRIHREDAAATLHILLDHPAPPALLLGVDDAPASREEVTRWLLSRRGHAAPTARSPGAPTPRGNKRCRNTRLRRLGVDLRYPTFREGYAALLDEAEA